MGFTFFKFLVAVAFLLASALAGPKSLKEVVGSSPTLRGLTPPDSLHVQVETEPAVGAKVRWVNERLLHEMGIVLPKDRAERDAAILEIFGVVVKKSDSKVNSGVAFSDKYGGMGMGQATGSGRAIGQGPLQSKGGGVVLANVDPMKLEAQAPDPDATMQQALKAKLSVFSHSHGGATATEVIREAIFGEVLHEESPFGANRVAFLIELDEKLNFGGGIGEKKSVAVRESSLRPAHFLYNIHLDSPEQIETHKARLRTYHEFLIKSFEHLGMTQGNTGFEKINSGMLEFSRRLGVLYGSQYARQIFRGQESNSNLELDGRLLDYGGSTLLRGYPKATLSAPDEFGNVSEIKDLLIGIFGDQLYENLPNDLKEAVPKHNKLLSVFEESLARTINAEFLNLLGIPQEWSEDLIAHSEIKDLTKLMRRMARLGNTEKLGTYLEVPQNLGIYNFAKLMPALAESLGDWEIPRRMAKVLSPFAKSNELSDFEQQLPNLKRLLLEKARSEGIPIGYLSEYMSTAATRRNETYSLLMRGPERTTQLMALASEGANEKNAELYDDYISLMLEKGVRYRKALPAFSTELETRVVKGTPIVATKVYNAKNGRREIWANIKIPRGSTAADVGDWRMRGKPVDFQMREGGILSFFVPKNGLHHVEIEEWRDGKLFAFHSVKENTAVPHVARVGKLYVPLAHAAVAVLKASWASVAIAENTAKVVSNVAEDVSTACSTAFKGAAGWFGGLGQKMGLK